VIFDRAHVLQARAVRNGGKPKDGISVSTPPHYCKHKRDAKAFGRTESVDGVSSGELPW
jgi:hypothetical protein